MPAKTDFVNFVLRLFIFRRACQLSTRLSLSPLRKAAKESVTIPIRRRRDSIDAHAT